ncbi:hypothetical protein [Rhodococcoides fascians]|uniref:hypothetical protein n=1 Tax=Rhodococcoides fascians TaxID=1828 RepID=UPI000691B9C4|nr:hypothetical protein [Rhodococcus fascians]
MTTSSRVVLADLAMNAVYDEHNRAVSKFEPFNSAHEGWAVLREEVDELWDEVKADSHATAVGEAIQVAAMALRFITDIGAKHGVTPEQGRQAMKLKKAGIAA